jgi:hypothetical protein
VKLAVGHFRIGDRHMQMPRVRDGGSPNPLFTDGERRGFEGGRGSEGLFNTNKFARSVLFVNNDGDGGERDGARDGARDGR